MSRLKVLPLLTGLLLSVAAQQQVYAAEKTEPPAPQAEGRDKPAAAEAAALPAVALTDDLLFQFLISEIAGQRGMLSLAKEGYLDLARKTRDPRVARRAVEIALYSRDQTSALEVSRLWYELEPGSERALQTLVLMLVAQGKLQEAAPYLEKMLASAGPAEGFLKLPSLFGKTHDTQQVLKLVSGLAEKYPDLAEAHFAVAHATLQAGRAGEALAELRQAEKLKPGWEPAALLQAQVLAKTSRAEALVFLKDFVAAHPQARDARLAYARMLVSATQLGEAHEQFMQLAGELPDNAEIALATGLLSLQMGRLDEAEKYLGNALELGQEDGGVVPYYLGQVAEERQDYELAMNRYQSITDGEYLVASRIRMAALLARQGKPDEARAALKTVTPINEAQTVQLIQAEADLLRETKDHAAVFALLDRAVKARPDNIELLYDRAMAAEKLNKEEVTEADLRKVIKLKPDYAQAYNALGYTLVEKTDRLNEAAELLDKANSLAPEDPFILDSLGWLHYRKGNLDRAREFLERAFRIRQDPEIAAHLGEVLWMKGSHEEASRLWQASLQSHPRNDVLLEILKKFQP